MVESKFFLEKNWCSSFFWKNGRIQVFFEKNWCSSSFFWKNGRIQVLFEKNWCFKFFLKRGKKTESKFFLEKNWCYTFFLKKTGVSSSFGKKSGRVRVLFLKKELVFQVLFKKGTGVQSSFWKKMVESKFFSRRTGVLIF